MTGAEIEELIGAYVATATLAVECGLDGVEIRRPTATSCSSR